MTVLRDAYDFDIADDGTLCGLVAGDQGWASTHIRIATPPAPAAVDGQRVKDGRPEGWTEALAISFMAANGHNPEMGMFAKSFNEGAWREIKTEWPEFIEFAGARIRSSLASTDATEGST